MNLYTLAEAYGVNLFEYPYPIGSGSVEPFNISGPISDIKKAAGGPLSPDLDFELPAFLDQFFMYTYAGHRYCSGLLQAMTQHDGGELSEHNRESIAATILNAYSNKWNRQWELDVITYDPLVPIKYTETRTTTDKTTETPGVTTTETTDTSGEDVYKPGTTETRTDTRTPNTTEEETQNTSQTEAVTETPEITKTTETTNDTSQTERGIFGFNSAAASDSDTETTTRNGTTEESETGTRKTDSTASGENTITRKQTGQETITGETTRAGTDTTNREETATRKTTHEGSNTTENTRTEKVEQEGDLGVSATAYALEQERKYREWNFFTAVIFKDLMDFLTLSIY